MKLQADTCNGVYEVEEFEEESGLLTVSRLPIEDFYDSLRTCKEGHILSTETEDAAWIERINEEYLIRRLA